MIPFIPILGVSLLIGGVFFLLGAPLWLAFLCSLLVIVLLLLHFYE